MSEPPTELPSFSPASTMPPALGSLSQSARRQTLKSARNIMILVGILTIGANVVFAFLERGMIDDAIRAEIQRQGLNEANVDQAKLQQTKDAALRMATIIHGGAIVLGIVFVLLGVFVERQPVAFTVTGLVLYVGAAIIFALIDPTTLIQGILFKIIIVVAMAKAISAALAYQREQSVTGT